LVYPTITPRFNVFYFVYYPLTPRTWIGRSQKRSIAIFIGLGYFQEVS
jgi:hypothetical protein